MALRGAIAALLLAAAPAHAAGPTVGWEWEVKPWRWVTTNAQGVPDADQKQTPCPSRLIRSTEMSPVNDALRLVEFTRDLGQSLEIRTGPIEYDDDANLARILVVLDAFRVAAAACVPGPHGCLTPIPDLVQTMNADARMAGAHPALAVEIDPQARQFNTIIRKCQLRWYQDPDYARLHETNTQTNVGLAFESVANGGVEPLFSRVSGASSGWEVSRRSYQLARLLLANPRTLPGFAAVPGIAEPEAVQAMNSPLTRSLLALAFYVVNAETYSVHYQGQKADWKGFESKNVQDAFLKTLLVDLVQHVRREVPDVAPILDGLAALRPADRGALANRICVAWSDQGGLPLSCRAKTDAMVAILSDPANLANRELLGVIPNPVAMFRWHGRDALVIEARRKMNPLNRHSTFVLGPGGEGIQLMDRDAMRALLQPLRWGG